MVQLRQVGVHHVVGRREIVGVGPGHSSLLGRQERGPSEARLIRTNGLHEALVVLACQQVLAIQVALSQVDTRDLGRSGVR